MIDSTLLPLCYDDVLLRPLLFKDADAYAAGTEDAAVREFGHLPEPEYTPETVRTMITREVTAGLERGDLAVLAFADLETDSFAGSAVIFNVHEGEAEIGFWTHPAHRGSGKTKTAMHLVGLLAQKSRLQHLTARTLPENIASQRVLISAGFTLQRRDIDQAPSGDRLELLHYTHDLKHHQPDSPCSGLSDS